MISGERSTYDRVALLLAIPTSIVVDFTATYFVEQTTIRTHWTSLIREMPHPAHLAESAKVFRRHLESYVCGREYNLSRQKCYHARTTSAKLL